MRLGLMLKWVIWDCRRNSKNKTMNMDGPIDNSYPDAADALRPYSRENAYSRIFLIITKVSSKRKLVVQEDDQRKTTKIVF